MNGYPNGYGWAQPAQGGTVTSGGMRPMGMMGGLDPALVMGLMGLGNMARKYGPGLMNSLGNFYTSMTAPSVEATATGSGAFTSSAPEILRGAQYGADLGSYGAGMGGGGGGMGAIGGGASMGADAASGAASGGSGLAGSMGNMGAGMLGTMTGQYAANQMGYGGIGSQLGGAAGSLAGGYFGGAPGAAGGGFLGSLAGGIKESGIRDQPLLGGLTATDPVASSLFDLATLFGAWR